MLTEPILGCSKNIYNVLIHAHENKIISLKYTGMVVLYYFVCYPVSVVVRYNKISELGFNQYILHFVFSSDLEISTKGSPLGAHF